MNKTAVAEVNEFRGKAIKELEKLKNRYLKLVENLTDGEEGDGIERLERAVRLLPSFLKTEANLISSYEENTWRRSLSCDLEPLFAVLRRVLGNNSTKKGPRLSQRSRPS
jgi:hypothetical protein